MVVRVLLNTEKGKGGCNIIQLQCVLYLTADAAIEQQQQEDE